MSITRSITTPRLQLMIATAESARAAADDDRKKFSALLDAEIPSDWPPQFMEDGMTFVAAGLEQQPQQLYTTWLVVLPKPRRTLIGVVGLKAPPVKGRVDLGYGIVNSHQGHGYATEATKRLIALVFEDSAARTIVAETMPELTASMRVLDKCGFVLCDSDTTGFSGEENVVQYELTRSQFLSKA